MVGFVGGLNPIANLDRAFCGGAQFIVSHGQHLNVSVDSVEQRAGDFRHVALDHARRDMHSTSCRCDNRGAAGIFGAERRLIYLPVVRLGLKKEKGIAAGGI